MLGDDPTIEAVEELSRRESESGGRAPTTSRGVPSSTEALARGKRTALFFMSYSHDKHENRLAHQVVELLKAQFNASPTYELILWRDLQILPGKDWHLEIQKAIDECDLGLLMVSVPFLGSSYIEQHELRRFLSPEGNPLGKPIVPVGLSQVLFDGNHDLKGIEAKQVYLNQHAADTQGRFFSQLRTKEERLVWVQGLFVKIKMLLDLHSRATDSAVAKSKGERGGAGDEVPGRSRSAAIRANRWPRSKGLDDGPENTGSDDAADDAEGESTVAAPAEGQPATAETGATEQLARHLRDTSVSHGDPNVPKGLVIPNFGTTGDGRSVDAVTFLYDWVTGADGSPLVYLLGEYGIGKTTTLKQLTLRLLDERKNARDNHDPLPPLPIFIDLRHYLFSRKNHVPATVHELLEAVLTRSWSSPDRPTVTAEEILRLVRDERAVLIFDGLDEKTVHLTPEEARAFLRVLWQALPEAGRQARLIPGAQGDEATGGGGKEPLGRVIISCRSHYFRDISEQTSMLTGEDREEISRVGFEPWAKLGAAAHREWTQRVNVPVFTLLPFTEEQIRAYLQGICGSDEARATGMWETILSIHNLRELAERPYLLALIVERIEELERLREKNETVNAARLYQLFTQRWLSRDGGKHSIDPLHKRILMDELAAELWRRGVKELPPDDLDWWLDRFLSENAIIRDAYRESDRKILKEDLRTACFVLRSDAESNGEVRSAFRFAHTSLQEFFLAAYLWHALREGDVARWALPMVSLETLDFLGQLLAIESGADREKCLRSLERVLEGGELLAAVLAFRYWLRAVETGLPEPRPVRVNLRGANLMEWAIAGKKGAPLRLVGADLAGAWLNGATLGRVDLSGADCQQMVLEWVDAEGSDWTEAKTAGLMWRGGRLDKGRGFEAEGAELVGVVGFEAE